MWQKINAKFATSESNNFLFHYSCYTDFKALFFCKLDFYGSLNAIYSFLCFLVFHKLGFYGSLNVIYSFYDF